MKCLILDDPAYLACGHPLFVDFCGLGKLGIVCPDRGAPHLLAEFGSYLRIRANFVSAIPL